VTGTNCWLRRGAVLMAIVAALGLLAAPAAAKPKFRIAWSIYVGWMPWDYAGTSGVLKKWADRNDVEIELVRMDYIPSVEAYVAKQVAGVVMTNMETLDMPAASGIDSTVLIVGDYSNGNDAILTRDDLGVKDLKGQSISLVELSVSHYLLARALERNGLKESDVKIVNTSDSDIASVFLANKSQKVVVTWNPMVMQIEQTPGIKKIFTSAEIPGEILDLMVVRTEVLKQNPGLGKALVGAWYEVMQVMQAKGPESTKALEIMAKSAGSSLVEFQGQLKTTAMFYTPQAAIEYTKAAGLKQKMDFVRQFCFSHGLLGENAKSADVVGISYPDGSIQGDANNVKMRFDTSFMQLAADGKLAPQ
jgi:NitT/TauT family transport system substrate-binding protein